MNVIDEIIEDVLSKFSLPKVSYQYQPFSKTHFIQVPKDVLENPNFNTFYFEASEKIYNDNSIEGILSFITEDSLTELDNPIHKFASIKDVKESSVISDLKNYSIKTNFELVIGDEEPNYALAA